MSTDIILGDVLDESTDLVLNVPGALAYEIAGVHRASRTVTAAMTYARVTTPTALVFSACHRKRMRDNQRFEEARDDDGEEILFSPVIAMMHAPSRRRA